jgi:EAL domain-containing protein (putative c-di-GMP-specific phosphodiesterase class I)
VNVSPRQFQETGFEELVRDTLTSSGIRPECLVVEVTEGLLMNDPERAVDTVRALAGLGVKVSVDDFGTGYSSLAYLKLFKVHELKIDQSFLREVPDSESDAGIVNAVIALARSLDLEVVAEGVETQAQLAFLDRAGCDRYQGFLFSRSVVPERFWLMASADDGSCTALPSRATGT